MSLLPTSLPAEFLPALLQGMLVNFEIAAIALVIGLALGTPLTLLRLGGGVAGAAAGSLVGLMRAAPTFVVMYFLLNAVPHEFALSGVMIVAVALVPYAAAYVADSGVDAVRQRRAGSRLAGYLILPNIARAFFVMVMSSSIGAAIGVACFGIPLQAGFAIIRAVQRRLGRSPLPQQEAALTGEPT